MAWIGAPSGVEDRVGLAVRVKLAVGGNVGVRLGRLVPVGRSAEEVKLGAGVGEGVA
jgi:hypothetical protein